MDCCVLDDAEIGRLRHYKIPLNHASHSHIDTKVAIDGVKSETFDLVDLGDNRYAVTPSKTYFLKRKPSGGHGGIDIIQRVLSNHILALKPLK